MTRSTPVLAEQADVTAPEPVLEAVPTPRVAEVVEDREEQLSLF